MGGRRCCSLGMHFHMTVGVEAAPEKLSTDKANVVHQPVNLAELVAGERLFAPVALEDVGVLEGGPEVAHHLHLGGERLATVWAEEGPVPLHLVDVGVDLVWEHEGLQAPKAGDGDRLLLGGGALGKRVVPFSRWNSGVLCWRLFFLLQLLVFLRISGFIF